MFSDLYTNFLTAVINKDEVEYVIFANVETTDNIL